MVNREISGSGRINASIFVDGRSMMKDDCSKSNTERRLVLEIKWIFSGDLCGDFGINSLQSGHSSLKIFDVDGLAWLWLVGI